MREPKAVVRDMLLERQGNLCFWCREPMHMDYERKHDADFASIEHVIPRSWGGKNSRENLALAHNRCNYMRGAKLKLPLAWVQQIHALLTEARGYLEGLPIAEEIDRQCGAMERYNALAYETIRSTVGKTDKHSS